MEELGCLDFDCPKKNEAFNPFLIQALIDRDLYDEWQKKVARNMTNTECPHCLNCFDNENRVLIKIFCPFDNCGKPICNSCKEKYHEGL